MENKKIEIYHVNEENPDLMFMDNDFWARRNVRVHVSNYRKVYTGSIPADMGLNDIYIMFNLNHPVDYRAHSMSVSDVVVITDDEKTEAHFCDAIGFKKIDDFFDALPEPKVVVTETTDNLPVSGHSGTWHTIDKREVGGQTFFLMEHDKHGDEAACIIVDAYGELLLDEIHNGFDSEVMRHLSLYVLPFPELPDDSISVKAMRNGYGYHFIGMLPMRLDAAKKCECQVYKLYDDDTESAIESDGDERIKEMEEHAAHGGIFGVEREDWHKFWKTKADGIKNVMIS